MFKYTTAIKKLRQMKARKKVVQGGTSSGKTYGIIPVISDKLMRKANLKATVVAETLPAVKEGALDIFKTFMFDTNRWIDEHWNASNLTYTFANGSRIQFKSFDSVGKAKASGKRDILFLNECNHIPFPIADSLMVRSNDIWMDFNPDEEFWAHTETLKEPNSEFLLLLYPDNEALPDAILEEIKIKLDKAFYNTSLEYPQIMSESNIKSSYWANWAKVYVFGQIGSLDGVVFDNWTVIDNIPKEARYVGSGLDFGYTNDPTAIVDIYIWNNKRILDESCYKKGMSNSDIAKVLRTDGIVYADSAEPKSIDEIKRFGIKIKPVTKGKDSINYGIQVMQEQEEYLVTKKSVNLIKELRSYIWDSDKNGERINKPIGGNDHAIDATRYHEMESVGLKRNHGKYNIY